MAFLSDIGATRRRSAFTAFSTPRRCPAPRVRSATARGGKRAEAGRGGQVGWVIVAVAVDGDDDVDVVVGGDVVVVEGAFVDDDGDDGVS